jgi:hypothetical protein
VQPEFPTAQGIFGLSLEKKIPSFGHFTGGKHSVLQDDQEGFGFSEGI